LCGHYRRLSAAGEKLPIVIAIVAREIAALFWAIGRRTRRADSNRDSQFASCTQVCDKPHIRHSD
jgi:hypothetical protein